MSDLFDVDAVRRCLASIETQCAELSAELAKGPEDYSPIMSFERFQEIKAEIPGFPHCLLDQYSNVGPHRCSQCETLVRMWMETRKGKQAA